MNVGLESERILTCLALLQFRGWAVISPTEASARDAGATDRTVPPHLRKNHRLPPPSASLIWVFFLPAYLDSCTQSQDAGIARVHGPPWGGKPQHGGPAQPTERQQPQHGHPQQVQSSRDGCSQPGTAVCSERAFLQWAEHEDGHEV